MKLNSLENLFLFRYARLILDNRQGLETSVGIEKQLLLSRLFSSLQPADQLSKNLSINSADSITSQLQVQARHMVTLADNTLFLAGQLKEAGRILALVRMNLQKMEQIVASLRQNVISFAAARTEFEQLVLENKRHLETVADTNRFMQGLENQFKKYDFSSVNHIKISDFSRLAAGKDKMQNSILQTTKIINNINSLQKQMRIQAQDLYFGADTIKQALGETNSIEIKDFSQSSSSLLGSLFNERT